MKLLLDTHLLIWAAIEDPDNELLFSAATIWEIAVKRGLGRLDFTIDPRLLRRELIDNDCTEVPITSEHAVGVETLPQFHSDPFDRILIAQSLAEGITLLTVDAIVARYPAPVRVL